MTRLNTCVAFLLSPILGIQAQTAPSAQELLKISHAQADFSTFGPYKLTANFLVTPLDKKGRPNAKKQQQGTLTVFRDDDRARVEAQLGADHETQFRIGNIRYLDPNGTLLAMLSLVNFDQSWDPERPGDGQLRKQYTLSGPIRKKINDAEAWCLESEKKELCFGVETSALLKAEPYRFSDYRKTGDLQFPRQVEIERREMPPVEVADISVTTQALAPDTFRVPERMLAIESCEDWRAAKPIFTPEPEFTDAARKHHAGGLVVLNLIIGMDGKVVGAQALTEDRYGLAQQATIKVKTWRFEPAVCGGHPVSSAMEVEVGFGLY